MMREERKGERTIEVLLVEDDEADAELTRELLQETRLNMSISTVQDGEMALDHLRNSRNFAWSARPDLIILDLNMPRKDGRELLAELKSDPELRRLPVVVLTTSEDERDVERCYDLGASAFLSKPSGFDRFNRLVQAFVSFWFTEVRYPGTNRRGE